MPLPSKKPFLPFNTLPPELLKLDTTLFLRSSSSVVILPLCEIDIQNISKLNTWLHEKELAQFTGYTYKKRKTEWLGGRLCSKHALHIFLRQQPKTYSLPEHHQSCVVSIQQGSPYFTSIANSDIPAPKLSISHSKDFATAMISKTHCGIDIQYPAQSLLRVKEKFCTRKEDTMLKTSLVHLSPLLRLSLLWSSKEALIKMLNHKETIGFHGIVLHKLTPQGKNNAILYFTRSTQQNIIYPVAAGILSSGYSLAFCCMPDTAPSHSTTK